MFIFRQKGRALGFIYKRKKSQPWGRVGGGAAGG